MAIDWEEILGAEGDEMQKAYDELVWMAEDTTREPEDAHEELDFERYHAKREAYETSPQRVKHVESITSSSRFDHEIQPIHGLRTTVILKSGQVVDKVFTSDGFLEWAKRQDWPPVLADMSSDIILDHPKRFVDTLISDNKPFCSVPSEIALFFSDLRRVKALCEQEDLSYVFTTPDGIATSQGNLFCRPVYEGISSHVYDESDAHSGTLPSDSCKSLRAPEDWIVDYSGIFENEDLCWEDFEYTISQKFGMDHWPGDDGFHYQKGSPELRYLSKYPTYEDLFEAYGHHFHKVVESFVARFNNPVEDDSIVFVPDVAIHQKGIAISETDGRFLDNLIDEII